MRRILATLLLLVVAAPAFGQGRGRARGERADAPAAYPEPWARLRYAVSVSGRLNPTDARLDAELSYRRRLLRRRRGLRWISHAEVGLGLTTTPWTTRGRLHVAVQPLVPIRLFAQVEAGGWHGTFDTLAPLSDPDAWYADPRPTEGAKATFDWGVTTGGQLAWRVGPLLLRDGFAFRYADADLPAEGFAFFEPGWARVTADGGWTARNDLDVVLLGRPTSFGLRWTITGSPGLVDHPDAGAVHHRIGPILAFRFANDPPGTVFNHPTLFATVQWWASHPTLAGPDVGFAPLVQAGFRFDGDLWVQRRRKRRPGRR